MRWCLLIGLLLPLAAQAQSVSDDADEDLVPVGYSVPVPAANPMYFQVVPAQACTGPNCPGPSVIPGVPSVPGTGYLPPTVVPYTPGVYAPVPYGTAPPSIYPTPGMPIPGMPAPNTPTPSNAPRANNARPAPRPDNARPDNAGGRAGNAAQPPAVNSPLSSGVNGLSISGAGTGAAVNSMPQGAGVAEGTAGLASSGAGEGAATTPPPSFGNLGIGPAGVLRGAPLSARVPIIARGTFGISDNESPKPLDRVFLSYNFYNRATIYATGPDPFAPDGRALNSRNTFPKINAHIETFGFEKAFLDGLTSFGMRVPVVQKDGVSGVEIDGFGHMTLISKVAFMNDKTTGDVFSGGLALTVPSGKSIVLEDGHQVDGVLFQPYVGFIMNSDRLYFQGFSAIICSTDHHDVTLWTVDLGVGYKIPTACDAVLTSLVPTIELHANIPLEAASIRGGGSIVFPDQIVLTSGVHFEICNRALFSVGMALPLTGINPYDFEVISHFNVRF